MPHTERSDRIRDLVRDLVQIDHTASDLRKYLGPEMGALNVKQTEGLIVLLQTVRGIILALAALNKELGHLEVDERSVQLSMGDSEIILGKGGELLLSAGDASIRMRKDGSIDIKGNDMHVRGAGNIEVKAGKDLYLKGAKVS